MFLRCSHTIVIKCDWHHNFVKFCMNLINQHQKSRFVVRMIYPEVRVRHPLIKNYRQVVSIENIIVALVLLRLIVIQGILALELKILFK